MATVEEIIRDHSNVEQRDGSEVVVLEHPQGENCPYCSASHNQNETVPDGEGGDRVIAKFSGHVETVGLQVLVNEYTGDFGGDTTHQNLLQEMESRGKGHERFIQQ